MLENAHRCRSPSAATRSRRSGAASGRRRAATASSPRPTSTSSTPARWPPHHDVELPLVTLSALERLHVDLGLPPVLMRVNNRRLAQGFYLGLDIEDPAEVLRQVDKIDKIGPDRVARAAGRPRSGSPGPGRRAASRWPGSRPPTSSFVDQVRALGVHLINSTRAWSCWPTWSRTAAPVRARPADRRSEDRPRPGLLHRHGLRDRAGRATSPGARSPPAAGTTRWPATAGRPTPGSGSRSVSPGCWLRCSARGLLTASRPVPTGGAGGGRRRGDPGRLDRGGRAVAGPGDLLRGRAQGRQVRQADPLRRPPRDPVRLVPARRPAARSRTSAPAISCRPTRPTGHRRMMIFIPRCGRTPPDDHPRRGAGTTRIATQRLAGNGLARAVDVVSLLACVQSQEYAHAFWSLGMRTTGMTYAGGAGRVRRRRPSCGPTSCVRPGTSSRPPTCGGSRP